MTLASSGTMSIGGTTTDRSINLELGRSATATSSLGETDLRSLAGVSSGTISISDFYGASLYDWTVTITLGSTTYFGQTFQGYGSVGNRPYGYAGRFSVPDCVAEAVREYVDDMYMSLASDSRIYFRDILELYRYWDGVQIHIYVPSKHNNTEDGFILDLSSPMCAGLMEWATTNNLITDIEEKNKYKGETDA